MKKIFLGVVAALMVLPAVSFAQLDASTASIGVQEVVQPAQPVGQAQWLALIRQQAEERKALNERLQSERDEFLKANPDVAARFEEQMKVAKERAAARKAAMPVKVK